MTSKNNPARPNGTRTSVLARFATRARALLDPRRHWVGLIMFAAALAIGILGSALWMRAHRTPPTPVVLDTAAATPDPVHRPLPAPMPGGLTSMPAEIPTGPNAAYIKPAPPPEPLENQGYEPASQSISADSGRSMGPADNPTSLGNEMGPQLVRRTQPQYPIDALRNHDEGSVQLLMSLDAQGGIRDVRISHSSRSRSLDRAAMEAVRQWQFRPAISNGQPVPSTVTETVDFRLSGN